METITKTVEQITGYRATDGTEFKEKEECVKYEQTCKCVIMSAYQKLVKGTISEYDLIGFTGCDDFYYDIVKPENADELEILNKALKFNYSGSSLTDSSLIGKVLLVGKDYEDCLTGWTGDLSRLIDEINENVNKVLTKEENANG